MLEYIARCWKCNNVMLVFQSWQLSLDPFVLVGFYSLNCAVNIHYVACYSPRPLPAEYLHEKFEPVF